MARVGLTTRSGPTTGDHSSARQPLSNRSTSAHEVGSGRGGLFADAGPVFFLDASAAAAHQQDDSVPEVRVEMGVPVMTGPGMGVIQRSVSVTLNKKNDPVIVSAVTVSSRTGTGRSYGQGSHNTSWITFVDMVKLRVIGKTLPKAAESLEEAFEEIKTFPGAAVTNANYIYARDQAIIAIVLAKSEDSKGKPLGDAIEELLTMRQTMAYTSTSDGNKSGKQEDWHTVLLDLERQVRRGVDITTNKYYALRFWIFWELFDYQPTASKSNDEIWAVVYQHLLSMQATYEHLFSKGHFTMAKAMQYLTSDTDNSWAWFTARITNKTKEYSDPKDKKQSVHDLLTGKTFS